MPTLKCEFSCPLCKRESGKIVQILASEGRLTCPDNSSHRWVDTAAFFADNPTMDFKPQLIKATQTDIGPLKLTLKNHLIAAAQAKFGDKLDATVGQLIESLVEGDMMVIGETDLKRIQDRMGQRPSNSSELYGMIYAKMCEVDEAKEERDRALKDLKAYEGMSMGRVVVDLAQNYPAAVEKAKNAEQPLKLWLETSVANMIENNWV